MKCLVCGANGFLGRRVVRILTENGATGVALDLLPSNQTVSKNTRFQFVPFDLNCPTIINERFDVIVYLAHKFIRNPEDLAKAKAYRDRISVNVAGVFSLLSSIAETERIIYGSSAFVYPWQNRENISEQMPPEPFSLYGWEKLAVEKILEEYCSQNAVALTILRFTQLYGAEDPHRQFITRMLEDAYYGRAVSVQGLGEDARDLLHVEDAAQAIWGAIRAGATGTFNVASGRAVDLEMCGHLCLELTGRKPSELVYTPRKTEIIRISYSSRKAAEVFGFAPAVSLRQGLSESLRSLKG